MPDISHSRIFHLNEERPRIVEDVIAREMVEKSRSEHAMELVVNDTAYHEIARLEGDDRHQAKLREWTETYRSLGKLAPAEKERLLRGLVTRYANDIVGNFDPRVYHVASNLVPRGLELLFSSQMAGSSPSLAERITLTGEVETLKTLVNRGTVILVPTHSSNLDSIVLGYALHTMGLPPFTYGAGKNLFSNVLISYFMNNLGAYKVDRRLQDKLYKDTLKTYSTVILERGYHSLFFPGGGRSRSGGIEQKLKLGLLGTGLTAYINNLKANKPNPEIYIVPCTINYPLVLEGASLIDDHLKIVGKNRYIIEDDEFSKIGRLFSYARSVLEMDARMFFRFGHPLDPFGNRVGPDGRSYDMRGRMIDLRQYVELGGEVRHDARRDAEYTRELGASIADSFKRDTVILTTHMVAFALFQLIAADHPELDLYHLIRLPGDTAIPLARAQDALEQLRERLIVEMAAGRIHLSPTVQSEAVERVLEVALRYFAMYHHKPLAVIDGDRLRLSDLKVLLYYRNRLTGFGLEGLFQRERAGSGRDEWASV